MQCQHIQIRNFVGNTGMLIDTVYKVAMGSLFEVITFNDLIWYDYSTFNGLTSVLQLESQVSAEVYNTGRTNLAL